MSTLAPPLLIGSSLFLQVTITTIKCQIGSKFSKIQLGTVELAAIDRLEKSPWTSNRRNVVSTQVPSFFWWIFVILAGNKDNYKSLDEFEFQPDSITKLLS